MRESTYRTIGIAAAYREGSSSGWYWVSTFGPDPNRSRQAIEDEQAEVEDGGRTSVTVRIPILPRVVVTPCEAELRRGDRLEVVGAVGERGSAAEAISIQVATEARTFGVLRFGSRRGDRPYESRVEADLRSVAALAARAIDPDRFA